MPFTSFSSAGVAAIQAAIVNTTGYPYGISGSLAAGNGAPMTVLKFAKRFGGQAPAPVRVTAIGDNNRNRHEYLYNAAQVGELQFMLGAFDADSHAGFTGTKKATDVNSFVSLMQSNAPANAAQAVIIATLDAQVADSGSFGLKKFINEIYPLCTVTPLYAAHAEVSAAEWQYQAVPTETDRLPWGINLTTTTHGATRAAAMLYTSDYPLTLETVITTTSQTTYNLTYTPATPTATYLYATKNGTVQTVATSYSLSGKTVTMTGATNNDVWVFRYEATDILAAN